MRPGHIIALTVFSLAAISTCSWATGDHDEEVELAPFMSRLQVFSQKLGYSIRARNVELAGFYLHEMVETIEEVQQKVPMHDGRPIGEMAGQTVVPELEGLEQALRSSDSSWERRWKLYQDMISRCNDCHVATAHGYIKILPAEGQSPFNQKFTPQISATPK